MPTDPGQKVKSKRIGMPRRGLRGLADLDTQRVDMDCESLLLPSGLRYMKRIVHGYLPQRCVSVCFLLFS